MSPAQAFWNCMNDSTALTSICTGSSIFHGVRPKGSGVPSINYFEIPGGDRKNGFEMTTFAVNCRATTASTAIQMARLVGDVFGGTSSTGMYGYQSGFEISRSSIKAVHGLIPETADNLYNAPIDILFVYPTSSVS